MSENLAYITTSEEAEQLQIIRQRRIKKIPTELRKKKIVVPDKLNWLTKFLFLLKNDAQFFRSVVQFSFILLCVWIGVEFFYFMQWGLSNGAMQFVSRPSGAEGFLPISALISFKYWIQTGIINEIHPSGLFIFIAIIVVSFFSKKAFCSWMCPIGTISESLWLLGKKKFQKNLKLPRWLDYPLRSLKYILLYFFVSSVLGIDISTLAGFIYSPYNKVADIKMYQFFANISSFAFWTIIVLVVFSVAIKNFWCRFLCPYGALLGIVSFLSPAKITRNKNTCINCDLCTKVCPSNIQVHNAGKIWSDECTACLQCVQVCPVKNTLDVRTHFRNTPVPSWMVGAFAIGIFVIIVGCAMVFGYWHNGISQEEYLRHFQQLDSALYHH